MLRRKTRRWKTALAVFGLIAGGSWVGTLLAVVVYGNRDTARPADAVVVLGAAQYVGHPSPVLRARLDHAIELWRRGLAPRVVLTGGTGEGDTTSEAAVGRRYVEGEGIPDSAVLLEANGRSTRESMQAVAAMMKANRMDTVILVSDAFHMLRLTVLARQFGLVALRSPATTSPISRNWKQRWEYRLSESLKTPVAVLLGSLQRK
jgi:uncharacterized SAM-binding protein YcdF (DUF218 family)